MKISVETARCYEFVIETKPMHAASKRQYTAAG